jgi:Recombination endonuclease VII
VKRCPRCGLTKPLEAFPRNRANKDGRMGYCKPCHNQIVRENRAKNHGSVRSAILKIRYGVSEVDIAWMRLQQGGKCAMCRKSSPEHVDHDHTTGAVRGLLCFNCNRALGYLGDDLELLYQLADYLEERASL